MQRDLSKKVQQIYGCTPEELSSHETRYSRLLESFAATFPGRRDQFIARAPGRVNLIGEHTDYNGYPVLPMAVDRDIVFIFAPRRDSTIEIQNENPRFGRKVFAAEFPVAPYQQGDWGNYVKAAVHGILEGGLVDTAKGVGFEAFVGGTIPESAGLSSSSALVVASALAFLAVNTVEVDRRKLADLLAHAERYVGSEGGGMDQAVSLLGETGKALRIDFFPLNAEPIALPKGISFVVCNSLIRATKSEGAQYTYNCRVVECRLAAALLSRAIELMIGKNVRAVRLADLSAEKLGVEQNILHQLALRSMGDQPLPLNAIAQRLGQNVKSVEREYCTARNGTVLKEPSGGFRVWKRYHHVVTEAARVGLTASAFQEGNINEVGRLMNQSHESCRDDYEISCPELEALISIALRHGAVGARLTGAGFGGCTVNAVPSEKVGDFIYGVTEGYYQGFVKRHGKSEFTKYQKLSDVIFPCRATTGAGVWPAELFVG